MNGLRTKTNGGQTVFSDEEEQRIVHYINLLADWGQPLTTFEMRILARMILINQGLIVKKFKDNTPGIEWAKGFIKRHDLTDRFAKNIKSD